MFCLRCLNENFQYVDNVINATHRFGNNQLSPDEIPGPALQCIECGLQFVNHGSHLEITEPDYLPAA